MFDDSTTLGYEAEWSTNFDMMLHALHAAGHVPDPNVHRYHCDCQHCTDLQNRYHQFPFRAQHDSSVSGEIISGIHNLTVPDGWARLNDTFQILEQTAFATDCEPSPSAGFHVHARTHNLATHRVRDYLDGRYALAVAGVVLSLPAITTIWGFGRHQTYGHNNTDTYAEVNNILRASFSRSSMAQAMHDMVDEFDQIDEINNTGQVPEGGVNEGRRNFAQQFLRYITGLDRHSYVGMRTRYNTLEFRFWRSTRVAWRMQLACLMSGLLVSPTYARDVLTIHGPRASGPSLANPDWLLDLIRRYATDNPDDIRYPLLVELMEEQLDYVNTTNSVPAGYTA